MVIMHPFYIMLFNMQFFALDYNENLHLGLKRIQRIIIVDQDLFRSQEALSPSPILNPEQVIDFCILFIYTFSTFYICINCLIIEQCFFLTPEEWGVKWMKRRERIREMGKKIINKNQ